MQNTEIPKEDEDPYLPIPGRLPPPDDFLLAADDGYYLQLFIDKGRNMIRPLFFFLPSACNRIFTVSLNYTRLRYAIIAIAMNYSERTYNRRCSLSRLNQYLVSFQTPSFKNLFQHNVHDQEGEIYATFLVLILTLVRFSETKDIKSLRRYVVRLYKLFRDAQTKVDDGRRQPLCPLLISIWRQVMRTNVTFALGVAHDHATFPRPASFPNGLPAQGHGPVRQYLGSASREFEDWTLAQLELDDLGNRILRIHLRANEIRSSQTPEKIYERELLLNTMQLTRENERWRSKPVILIAEYMENLYRQQLLPEPPPEKTFLQYPTIRFKNPLYACLLLTHYALVISLSLILDPTVGPRTQDRLFAAIEICRIYAALGGNHPVGSLTCLASVWWAGLTFDSKTFPNGMFCI